MGGDRYLFFVVVGFGAVWRERERDRERDLDRQTERQAERQTAKEIVTLSL